MLISPDFTAQPDISVYTRTGSPFGAVFYGLPMLLAVDVCGKSFVEGTKMLNKNVLVEYIHATSVISLIKFLWTCVSIV